ncbi:aluminum-activated malate transporter 12-like isoform X1 [Musa acuminata AAA Group]|uniref:aluminum-activated malate transporter 12-like isoform X1 n=1 Tax=Musa acuminata AAA Group TaxID=214697 RepID=UPI0031D9B512
MALTGTADDSKGKNTKCKLLTKDSMEKMVRLPVKLWLSALEVGREDPRRLIHALKVGVALTLVSLLYLLEPLFEGVGRNAMWAVMTVVVVLEFTAGATLCKGVNRGIGTLCAASLAFVIEFMAEKSGRACRGVFIGVSVFLVGFFATYLRFVPYIKRNYDYGVVIFLLTFNLITVSSYRVQNVLRLTRDRLTTIAIGCGICLFMSLLVLPKWSGEDLHNSTVYKLEMLARSIEACVNEYFRDQTQDDGKSSKDQIYKGCRAVLDSKSSDESLVSGGFLQVLIYMLMWFCLWIKCEDDDDEHSQALFGSWEPRHSRHCYSFPWQQYVKLGAVLRHFGYTAVALHGCLESEIQTPLSVRLLFRDPCSRVAGEVCKVFDELARSIRNRRHCSPNVLSDHLHEALQDLNSAIRSQPRLFLGSKKARPAANERAEDWRPQKNTSSGVALPSAMSDITSLQEWRGKRVESTERKVLRPTLSRIAITSLEFSEALPFAAFASLLVEMVARLELVIEEVEELGRAANFKEFSQADEIAIEMGFDDKKPCVNGKDFQSHVVHQAAE